MTGNSRLNRLVACVVAATCCLATAKADDGGSYSGFAPYSIFGVGDISAGGSAYNMTMGGVGIASRNNRYLNAMNPAAVTARDSLAFMSDVSLMQNNTVYRQGSRTSACNVFNMNDFMISTPIAGKAAMMFGIKPYSTTGYSYGYYETNPYVLSTVGNVAHEYSGQGSMYQLFLAAGVPLWNRLSIGAEYIHYFGNMSKTYTESFADEASLGISRTSDIYLNANTAKLGLQYEQPIGDNWKVCAGATYKFSANLNGYVNGSTTSGEASLSTTADTLKNSSNPVTLADEMGFGLSVNYMNKLRAEVDFTMSDWTNSGFEKNQGFSVNGTGGAPIFTSDKSYSVRAGAEYIPNPNDIRYYHNLIAYRAGVYFSKQNFCVNGNAVYSRGITFGATLPVFRWYNGVTIGMEIGQRGTVKNNMIRETYVGFNFGVNLFDIWFQQHRYE